MEGDDDLNLLLEKVEDITEDWVTILLNKRKDHSGPRPLIQVRKWSRHECPSKDALAGFSSSRATVTIEYDVTYQGQKTKTVEETLVVKVRPTHGLMAELLTSEGMHHIEVGQYSRFLRALHTWEKERRGGCPGITDELVPSYASAISTEKDFTIILPDLRYYGYRAENIQTGLSEQQLLTAAEKVGRYHGTVVAFKAITGIDIEEAFPKCFNIADRESKTFTIFAKPSFEQFKLGWKANPEKAELLKDLESYEDVLIPFVVNSLKPQEPFATVAHGDLQASNMFFKETTDGELSLKLIDWATARHTQGPVDFVYLLNISVDTEVRRKVWPDAVEIYFESFNKALDELGANISYPRSTFDAQLKICMQLIVIWSIMSCNIFRSTTELQKRLDAIVTDVLTNPEINPPVI